MNGWSSGELGVDMATLAKTVTIVAGITTAAVLVAAPAPAAPSGPGSAQDTVKSLEDSGYTVIVSKTGSAPLTKCAVSSIRPGRDVTEMRRNVRDRTVERVVYKTIYVDVTC
ncbi:Uncharacterised protein [Mycolicibacterium gilvum]|uniref:Uncharacterized protein n=2 Tax=Mycolicibacterium gilvum TaxID=1804 RepID=A0A378SP46_9MYCO|nr:Uncharacterised protein [Mycolicibacterium gilvum]